MELFDLLCKLSQAHGPSGDEGEIRETIAQLAKPFADEVRQDTLGNLIVRKKGNGAKVMFAAHMDSIVPVSLLCGLGHIFQKQLGQFFHLFKIRHTAHAGRGMEISDGG